MMTDIENLKLHILSLIRNSGFQNEAAQVQAKALLSKVAEQIPSYEWKYIPQRLVRNIVTATFELEIISEQYPNEIDKLAKETRRLALIWESLAQLCEATTKETALLNAAINYELAGYQANAMCIARQLEEHLSKFEPEKVLIWKMFALFLQRRFLKLLDLSKNAQAEPKIEKEINFSIIEAMANAITGNAISYAVNFFLNGDRKNIEKAIEILDEAKRLFISMNFVKESNLIQSIRSLLPIMEKRSTWTLLSNVVSDQPKWQRYLKLLSRGLGTDIYMGRSISELWPSQIVALEKGLLNTSSNKIVKMPTSSGKTRIAELAIVHTLVNNPGAKCIYVAPYRALVSELEQSFLNLLNDLGYRVSTITGTYESDEFEELLVREVDVLVTTPEKLDLLLRAQPDFLEKVRLFVLDELQIVHDRKRGTKFEILLARLKKKLPDTRFLILSAVIPKSTLEDFAKWFNASSQGDILTTTWRPSIQRYAKFEWFKDKTGKDVGVIRYTPEEDIEMLNEFVPGVIRQNLFVYSNPDTGRRKQARFPDISSRSQVAAELAFKFAELGPVLVFCSQTNYVESVAKALQERLRLSYLVGQDRPSYFQVPAGTRSILLSREWLGDRPITSWLESGIGDY
jgi:hypothetical protein